MYCTQRVEATIFEGQNMEVSHSLRCKQVDMQMADTEFLKSIQERL